MLTRPIRDLWSHRSYFAILSPITKGSQTRSFKHGCKWLNGFFWPKKCTTKHTIKRHREGRELLKENTLLWSVLKNNTSVKWVKILSENFTVWYLAHQQIQCWNWGNWNFFLSRTNFTEANVFAMNEFQMPSAITEKSVITLICLPSTNRKNKLIIQDRYSWMLPMAENRFPCVCK